MTSLTHSLGDQAATAYAALADRLARAGSGWGDVTVLREYVHVSRVEEAAETAAARAEALGGTAPPLVTTVVEDLLGGGELFRVAADTAGVAPDGVVHLPTVLPVDRGEVVAPGDFRGQYRWCLERTGELLEALGLSLAHLVQTIDFSTAATRDVYPRCGRPRKDLLGPVYPGAAGILVSRLPHPDVLVGFEMVASRHLPEAVNPGWSRYETLTYNPAVRAGDGLFGSGFAALDPATQHAVHDGDMAAQTEYTYGSITQVLTAAGAGPEHLSRVAEYVTPAGVGAVAELAAARAAALPGSTAPVTTVGCATLLRPEFLLEVVPTAVLP